MAHEAARLRKQVSTLDYLVRLIEFDEEWSAPWLAAHPRPGAAEATGESADEGTA